MSEFDFKGTKAAESKTFLTPGIYDLTVTSAKFEPAKESGKNPFLVLNMSGEAGQVSQKFYITPKTMDRLVYLHEGMFNKPLSKAFDSADAVGLYFEKAFTSIKPTKRILVGGQEGTDGRVYANFGYANFIAEDDAPLGTFAEGSAQWNYNVKKNKTRPILETNDAMLPSSAADTDDDDDLPF